ncbi:response regulator protein [Ectothiorhodospira sp. PHS-1]|uniref:response regulator n=1 Tax=Ectothiorhodospira sp. PHS-1 TaxID=519989 RepID=UPI00024A8A02|nr:response regulator transcription factor [Ectothiorhodospira sp. PHS-1]EHQ53673.1 response regulator protein [Ectothiorhodospira sp. PHS-1]
MRSALVVEDHPDTRVWLGTLIEEAFPGIELEFASTFGQGMEAIGRGGFNLALVDISLPDGSGIDLVAELNERAPETYVVVTTIYDDDRHLFASLRAGAKGYLLKDQQPEKVVVQLRGIAHGEPPLSPGVARRILRYFSSDTVLPVEREAAREATGSEPRQDCAPLSNREVEVLRLLSRGYNRGDIATALAISPNTAAGYIKAIYRKLNVSGRAEATLEAVRLGLVDGTR